MLNDDAQQRRRRTYSLAVALVVSLSGWTVYLINQPRSNILGDLSRGWYSDHFSHMNAARAFIFGGVDLWSNSLQTSLKRVSDEEAAQLPADLHRHCTAPQRECYRLSTTADAQKPIIASWSHLPRPYPPGDLLGVLPVALLYHLTPISFETACHFLIWLFVLYAHLAVFFFLQAATALKPPALVACLIFYFESIHWSLEGFYDSVAVIPLAIMAIMIVRKNWLSALLAYAAAAFLHFRAYLYGPWALLLAWRILASREWRSWPKGRWHVVAIICALSLASLASFYAISPHLRSFPLDNQLSIESWNWNARIGLVALFIGAAALLIWSRSWMDLVMCIWVAIMVVNLRQAFAWHLVLLLPWLVIRETPGDPQRLPVADGVKLLLVLALGVFAFRASLLPGWLAQLP